MYEGGEGFRGSEKVLSFMEARESRLFDLEMQTVEQGFLFARTGLRELGLDDASYEVAQQYFHDMDVVIADVAPSDIFPEGSQITVVKRPSIEPGKRSAWRRQMILHPKHIEYNYKMLDKALNDTDISLDESITMRLAQLWAVFGQVSGVASEAAYIVSKHNGKYSSGFNGHSPYFNAHKFFSEIYKERNPGKGIRPTQDAFQLSSGVSLYLLGAFLRSQALIGTNENVQEVIEAIIHREQRRNRYTAYHEEARAFPHDLGQILARVRDAITPPEKSRRERVRKNPSRYRGFFLVKS